MNWQTPAVTLIVQIVILLFCFVVLWPLRDHWLNQVNVGAALGILIAQVTHQAHKNILLSIGIAYGVALVCWIIGDILFGPIVMFDVLI